MGPGFLKIYAPTNLGGAGARRENFANYESVSCKLPKLTFIIVNYICTLFDNI